MSAKLPVLTILAIFCTSALQAQTAPIYQVTVVERTVRAVDYQYRNGPTRVDFRGTVLMPPARGTATVESKTGRTEIAAKFDHLTSPSRFGPEYLTYVLWAITPQGHPKNLGEVVADSGNRARLDVTTDLQAFGMIITAEPYAAVRQPSNVVVLENEIRPDTTGHTEPIQAKVELLPRGQYTYNVPPNPNAPPNGQKVSMDRYEAMLEVYEAQNAVQIAQAAGADRYAADTFARAQQHLRDAQQFEARHVDRSTIVTAARLAAQTAEDARILAQQRKHDEEVAQARAQAEHAREQQARAEAEAARLRAEASADRMQLEQERAARKRVEAEAAAAPQPRVEQPVAPVQASRPAPPADSTGMYQRTRLLADLNSALPALDTPRGLVVTVTDADFRGPALRSDVYPRLARVAAVLAAHPGLVVMVEGNSDSARDESEAYDRAVAVRNVLVNGGIPASAVSARGLGAARPLVSNDSPAGRRQNRRVEITVSGGPIGSHPYWDKPYALVPPR